MADTLTVKNPRTGNTVAFSFDGENDPRRAILESRIASGKLNKASGPTKQGRPEPPANDPDAGVRDEKGDLLKSVHGGGVDPDADGDALGVPSGSKATDKKSDK